MTKREKAEIEKCIRRAIGRGTDEWYAVTRYPDGHYGKRCGIGVVTYSEDEYFGRTTEQTIFVQHGIPDPDPDGESATEEKAIADWVRYGLERYAALREAERKESGQEAESYKYYGA